MTNLIFAYLTIGAVIAGIIVVKPRWIIAVRLMEVRMGRTTAILAAIFTLAILAIAWPAFVRELNR
jgi:hypothetical protein